MDVCAILGSRDKQVPRHAPSLLQLDRLTLRYATECTPLPMD